MSAVAENDGGTAGTPAPALQEEYFGLLVDDFVDPPNDADEMLMGGADIDLEEGLNAEAALNLLSVKTPEIVVVEDADVFCTRSPVLCMLSGLADQMFICEISSYLDFDDICKLASTCRYFAKVCESPIIWSIVYKRDFICTDSQPDKKVSTTTTKDAYLKNYSLRQGRVLKAKKDEVEFQKKMASAATRKKVQEVLDIVQLRAVMPLCLTSLFLSTVLFCQKVDGLNISYWMCSVPILFSVTYFGLSVLFVKYVHSRRDTATSIFYDCWTDFTGPVVNFVRYVLHKSRMMTAVATMCALLSIAQVALVAAKLSSSTPERTRRQLAWGYVFLPLWCFFALFCALPITKRVRGEMFVFLALLLLVWIPFFILFVCLTVKLHAQEKGRENENIRLVYIFIPFWIIEGVAVLAPMAFLGFGLYR